MDERWERALAGYTALPMGRRKVEYNTTIRRALQARYDEGLEWVAAIAKEGFPDTPALWATERTADVAFGLRARQILGLTDTPPGHG
jgi:hypothetical protein